MKSLLSRLRFAIAALALLCSVSAVAHDYAMADSAVVDTISAPHAKWYRQLIDNGFHINDPDINYPRFWRWCVDVYNWGDRTFNSYDPDYVVGAGKNWKAGLKSYNWTENYTLLFPHKLRVNMVSDIFSDVGAYLSFMAVSVGYTLNANDVFGHPVANHHNFDFNFCCALITANLNLSSTSGGTRITRFGDYNKGEHLSQRFDVSLANGGGYSGQGSGLDGYTYSDWRGAQYGELNMKFRRPDGTFDYGAIQDLNAASTNGSKLVMSESINSHKWFGLVSSYKKELELGRNKLNLTGGIDLRYYVGDHKNKINDLYGGEYFIDYSTRKDVDPLLNSAAANPNWKYEKLGIGDIVYRNYLGYTVQEGIYGQGEYTILDGKFNFVLSGALNNTSYWRRDKFYYDKANEKSETVNFIGGTIKGGANYNIDDFNNVFFNLGYISRAPFFSGGAFLNSTNSNAINKDAVNEKVMSYEIGYGYNSRTFAISVNAYWTKWMDRSGLSRRGEFSRADGTFYMNMTGVDARHMGIEMNFNWIPVRWLNIDGMISWGDWIWDSNANGYFYNQLGQPIQNLTDGALADGIGAENHLKSTLNQKGVKVGGSAQTTGSLSLTFLPFKGFRIGGDWVMNARNYSDFYISPSSLGTKAINVNDLWQIPWGQQLDLNASYRFKIGNVNATLYGNVYNLFNYNYIMDAQTPTTSNGTWQEAYSVFYSFGRTYTVRMRINF